MVKLSILPDSSQTGAHQQTAEVRGLKQQVRAHADMSDALPPYLVCAHQSSLFILCSLVGNTAFLEYSEL